MANGKTSIQENMSYNSRRWYKKFSQAPMELKVFAIFAAVVSVMQLVVAFILPREFFSWYAKNFSSITGSNYMTVLIMLMFLIYIPDTKKRTIFRFAIAVILLIGIAGNSVVFSIEGLYNYPRIIFTIVVPAFWILLMLFSPAINRFCKNIALR
ncbi:hypothetical protein [Ferruginibacter sp.]|nr:hypothetical protein [Ferruginibacter sp.]